MAACWLAVALATGLAAAPERVADPKPAPAPGIRRALIVCGLPGDDEHRKMYAEAVEKIAKALTARCGFAAGDVFVRFGTPKKDGDGPALSGSRGLSDREGIAADAAELQKRSGPDDAVWVIVLGHGHLDGRRAWLNIPGPDLDARAFGKLFEGLRAREQVFFITTSASGFFLKPLSAPGRVVITATEADQEVNETLFPLALADALETTPEDADRDGDGALNLFELYLAVVTDVMQRFTADENLPTEHAQIDDNGDGRGSEVQERYLPAELGGLVEKPAESTKKDEAKKDKDPKAGAGAKEKAKPPEPKLGPKDDGALASRIIVVPKPAAGAETAGDDPKPDGKASDKQRTDGKSAETKPTEVKEAAKP